MSQRLKKHLMMKHRSASVPYLYTGGLLTPYMCPMCGARFTSSSTMKNSECSECGQQLGFTADMFKYAEIE